MSERIFQYLSFLGFAPHFQKDGPTLTPPASPMVPKSEALYGFQLLQANFGVQGANELLNSV